MRLTYHLAPATAWAGRDPAAPIEPASLATEGFIHCTDGGAEMLATANRHYRDDPREFVVLTVDLDATGSAWRFDDPQTIYPHVYGPMAPAAVIRAEPMPRAADGTFLPFAAGPREPEVPTGVRVETIYVVEATYTAEAAALRPAVRPEHLGHIADLIRAGRVIEAGGFADLSRAILLVHATSADEALSMFREDVYTRTGVWTDLRAAPYGRVIAE